jgi:hypothetical protein
MLVELLDDACLEAGVRIAKGYRGSHNAVKERAVSLRRGRC